jgi:uncharacterized LabA/DUF88 family protein
MTAYAFIDASNLFYGGEKSLGWKIDYHKLVLYLQKKYGVSNIYYFGGVETYNFEYDYLSEQTAPLDLLEQHLVALIKHRRDSLTETELLLIRRHLQRVRFYRKLEQFGYLLFLKKVKLYSQDDGSTKRKANCDVDMAFQIMKEQGNFDRCIVLSGDGDFLPLLKYLRGIGKEVIVLGRGPRTAKEIRKFAGGNFRDFEYLKNQIRMEYN